MLPTVKLIPQHQFTSTEAIENGATFIENAIIKARHACHHSGQPALADDSGLCVDALNGEPGLHSARYGGDISQQARMTLLLDKLADTGHEDRAAHFVCVLALLQHEHDPDPVIAIGRWQGQIVTQCRGLNGFGYDPIFQPQGYQQTAAELTLETKNQLSHRAQALQQLKAMLEKEKMEET